MDEGIARSLLVPEAADVPPWNGAQGSSLDRALQAAVMWDDVAAVQRLLEAGADCNACLSGCLKITLLRMAAAKCRPQLTRVLIAAGAHVDNPAGAPPGRDTPLLCALRRGHTGVVDDLLRAGASAQGQDGRSPLLEAMQGSYPATVRRLLRDMPPAELNAHIDRRRAEFVAAFPAICADMKAVLLAAGATGLPVSRQAL